VTSFTSSGDTDIDVNNKARKEPINSTSTRYISTEVVKAP